MAEQLEHDVLLDMLTKYAITANGIALSISLVALASVSSDSVIKLTTFPFWCFFVGMICSGLFAFTRMTWSVGVEAASIKADVMKVEGKLAVVDAELDRVSAAVIQHGVTDPDIRRQIAEVRADRQKVREQQEDHIRKVAVIEKDFNPEKVKRLRHAQELFFTLSYICLLVGIASVICAIKV